MHALKPIQLRQFLKWASGELTYPASGLLAFYAANVDSFQADYAVFQEEFVKAGTIIQAVATMLG